MRGGLVTIGGQGASIAIQLTSTVILARLLSVDDYGTVAMVLAIVSFAGLFRDLGLSAAAVQKKDITRAQQSNLFWINVAMGALLTSVVAACSPLVAWFYGKPELAPVTLALSATFLIGSLGTQHGAMLVRQMQFARNTSATILGSLAGLVVSVGFALSNYGYWALVWAHLVAAITTTTFLSVFSSFRPGWPSRDFGMRDMMKFGANVTAFDFFNYFHRNLDNILIGRFWGPEPLGLYSRAYALLMFPINAIKGPLSSVAFPALSKLQNQPEAFRHFYRSLSGLIAAVSMPLTAFLMSSSAPIIDIALGNRWAAVVPLFNILGMVAFIQPVSSLRGTVLLSLGLGRRYMLWGIINASVVSVAFIAGIPWGAMGVATGYVVATYLLLPPSLMYVFHKTPVAPSDFWRSIGPSAVCAIVPGLAVVTLFSPASHHLAPLVSLLMRGVTYALVFFAVSLLFEQSRRNLREVRALVAKLWVRR